MDRYVKVVGRENMDNNIYGIWLRITRLKIVKNCYMALDGHLGEIT